MPAIRGQIASGIDILVHLERMRDKSRKVVCIAEVVGMEGGEVKLQDLFSFMQDEGLVQVAQLQGDGKWKKAGLSINTEVWDGV